MSQSDAVLLALWNQFSDFPALVHRYSMNQQTYIANLLQRRIKRHGLDPTGQQFNELFRDSLDIAASESTRRTVPKESKLWLLEKLDLFLLGHAARQKPQ